MNAPWFAGDPEFVSEWDVARDANGEAITITETQGHAISHAMRILAQVERAEGGSCNGIYEKSRLLGRMLYQGLPPTRTKPPYDLGAPEWSLLPGGDPFVTAEKKAERAAATDAALAAGKFVLICRDCGYSGPVFRSRVDLARHETEAH